MTDLRDAPIFLIGYRGTGKTSVADELARRMGYDSLDADDEIERRAGKTIAAIFADEGEAAFRDLEERIVEELSRGRRTIVALGGGAVLREMNRRTLASSAAAVVWLTASVDTILQRIAADESTAGRRPNLTKAGGRQEVESVLAQRTPIYRACATLVVDTQDKTPAEVADEIFAKL